MKKTLCAVIFALFSSCGQQPKEEVVSPVDDGGRGVEGGIVIIDNPDDSVVIPED